MRPLLVIAKNECVTTFYFTFLKCAEIDRTLHPVNNSCACGFGAESVRSVSCQIHIWYFDTCGLFDFPHTFFSVIFLVLSVFVVCPRIHTVLLIVQFPRDAGIRDANLGS